ncbi:hypothetical protein ACIBSV_48950 [Embleya sp. NPDC050154]|uniref:hypothetical protein n=1 Tax=Embleya sp. NPDC050154 TaxID=3363988 RepID=UPI0037A5CF2A
MSDGTKSVAVLRRACPLVDSRTAHAGGAPAADTQIEDMPTQRWTAGFRPETFPAGSDAEIRFRGVSTSRDTLPERFDATMGRLGGGRR